MKGKYYFEVHLSNDRILCGNLYNVEDPEKYIKEFFTGTLNFATCENGVCVGWRGEYVIDALLHPANEEETANE